MTVYNLLAPVYGAWAALTEAKAHRLAIALLRRCPCESLLEVAIGTGVESAALSDDPGRRLSVGVDLSTNMLKRAHKRITHKAGARGVLCQADARALPFRSSVFDCLLSCYTLDLLPEGDIATTLLEFERVLRGGGRLILVVMSHQKPLAQQTWMLLFRHIPVLVGYCRPIDAANRLRVAGWNVESREQVNQNGFRSEVLVARQRQSIPVADIA